MVVCLPPGVPAAGALSPKFIPPAAGGGAKTAGDDVAAPTRNLSETFVSGCLWSWGCLRGAAAGSGAAVGGELLPKRSLPAAEAGAAESEKDSGASLLCAKRS